MWGVYVLQECTLPTLTGLLGHPPVTWLRLLCSNELFTSQAHPAEHQGGCRELLVLLSTCLIGHFAGNTMERHIERRI